MKIDEYIEILKKEYNAKVIDMKKEIRDYFSTPTMYGDKYDDVYYVSEHEINSDLFKTLVVEGKNIDPLGKYEYGMTADIIFVEYDKDENVLQVCRISTYRCVDKNAESKFYRILSCYENE